MKKQKTTEQQAEDWFANLPEDRRGSRTWKVTLQEVAQLLQAERQRCEEMVEAVFDRLEYQSKYTPITLHTLQDLKKTFTHPNNPK